MLKLIFQDNCDKHREYICRDIDDIVYIIYLQYKVQYKYLDKYYDTKEKLDGYSKEMSKIYEGKSGVICGINYIIEIVE